MISTGNELTPPGSPLVPGKIWDSNSFMLAAAARQAGLDGIRHETVRDEPELVLAAIKAAAATSDLLVTSGGVSMGGEHDVVKAALGELGSVGFRKVAMQPGMPQGFGLIGDEPRTPIFTLPGNPVSAFVSFRSVCAAGRQSPAGPGRRVKASRCGPGWPGPRPRRRASGRSCAGCWTARRGRRSRR